MVQLLHHKIKQLVIKYNAKHVAINIHNFIGLEVCRAHSDRQHHKHMSIIFFHAMTMSMMSPGNSNFLSPS